MELKCKLGGQTQAISACAASSTAAPAAEPAAAGLLVASGSEGGRLCVHDVAEGRLLGQALLAGSQGASASAGAGTAADDEEAAITSLAFHPSSPHLLYAALGRSMLCLDMRQGLGSPAATYALAKDEVNQVAVNPKGAYLAGADDSGDIQVVDLAAGRAFKCLRAAHSNIASALSFRPHRPWELLSGGMDMTVARWDFSSGKSLERWSVNQVAESTSENQLFNPPLVHALAVPATSSSCRPWSQLVAVARGDGTVQVWDADAPAPKPSPGSSGAGGSGGGKSGKKGGSKGGAKQAAPSAAAPAAAGAPAGQEAEHSAQGTEAGSESQGTQGAGSSSSSSSPSIPSLPPGTWLGPRELGRAQGGHTRPASSLAFAWLEPAGASVAAAGSSGSKAAGGSQGGPTHLVSGGEDRRILVWRLRAPLAHADAPLEATGAARATGEGAGSVTEPAGVSSQEGPTGTAEAAPWSELALDFKHGRKVNQLCVGSWQGGPSLLFVADTSKLLSCYRMDATSFNGGWL